MPNESYYGIRRTQFPPSYSITSADKFLAPVFDVDQPTYERSGAITYACAVAKQFPDKYYQPFEPSAGWCAAEANSPLNLRTYVTGNNQIYPDSIRVTTSLDNPVAVSLGCVGTRSSSISSEYLNYFKSSNNSTNITSYIPVNYKPEGFTFTPTVTEENNGFTYIPIANGYRSSLMAFPFNEVRLVPFVQYYTFKSGKTIEDLNSATDVSELSNIIDTTITRDLMSFYNTINFTDNIVIRSIFVLPVYMDFDKDPTSPTIGQIASQTSGTSSKTTGYLFMNHLNLSPVTLNFTNWYKTEDPESYSVKIDISSIASPPVALSSCTVWNSKTEQSVAATFNSITATAICGSSVTQDYSKGYVRNANYSYLLKELCVGNKMTIKKLTTSNYREGYCIYAPLSAFGSTMDDVREYVRKLTAYFGMYFTDAYYPDITNHLIEEEAMLGIIDGQGITHGQYSKGTENKNQPQYAWGDDPLGKTPYNPNVKPKPDYDPNKYNDSINRPTSRSLAAGTRKYCGDANNINTIVEFCNSVKSVDTFTDYNEMQMWLSKNFLTSNPIDNIVGCKWYPFDTADFIGTSSKAYVKLGNAYVNVTENYSTPGMQMYYSTYPVTQNTLYLGHFDLKEAYADFRDYAPYCDATIYLPYCGTSNFPLAYTLDHTIFVQYKVDIVTGSCTAIVTLDSYDGNTILTSSGNLSVDIPLSGAQQAQYQNGTYAAISSLKSTQLSQKQNLYNNVSSLVKGGIELGTNIATKNAMGGVSSGIKFIDTAVNTGFQTAQDKISVKNAEYSVRAQPIEKTVIGCSSAADGSICYQYPTIYISRPVYDTTGFNILKFLGFEGGVVNDITSLNDYQGRRVTCGDYFEFNITGMTPEEEEELKGLLQQGLVLN